MSDLVLTHASRSDARPATRTIQFVLNVLCLCVPAFINGAPLVFPDTRAYFMGGHTAGEKIASRSAVGSLDGPGDVEDDVTVWRDRPPTS